MHRRQALTGRRGVGGLPGRNGQPFKALICVVCPWFAIVCPESDRFDWHDWCSVRLLPSIGFRREILNPTRHFVMPFIAPNADNVGIV